MDGSVSSNASTPIKWNEKNGGEIYDVISKAGYGYVANRLIRNLKNKNYLPEDCLKTVAKKKEEKNGQRLMFLNIFADRVKYLRKELQKR